MGASRIYKVQVPFNAVDLPEVDYAQSADVLYLVHWDYVPSKLLRFGHTNWQWQTVAFGPELPAPTGVGASPTVVNDGDGPPGGDSNSYPSVSTYQVTAISDETGQESRASSTASATNDLSLKGNFNTVTWSAVSGADRYTIYKSESGASATHGYIGDTTGLSFTDQNIGPDLSDTPPLGRNPLEGAGNYPSTVCLFEQRLVVGRSKNRPNGIWTSRSGDFENLDTSRPSRDSDAISFAITEGRLNSVNALVPSGDLLALTSDAIFKITGANQNGYLTPSLVRRRMVSYGSSRLKPLPIGTPILYKPTVGSTVETLGYSFDIDGYRSSDVSIFSPHLFRGFDIVSWAYAREPLSVVWAVRSDGKLLAFCWEQDQQVWGWSLCETEGLVKSVCAVTEGGEDRVYLIVERTIGNRPVKFIERMASPLWEEIDDACHLDCAVSLNLETPTATITAASHLEGKTVSAVVDGSVVTGLRVTGGVVTLPVAGRRITVGLPYTGTVETLPLHLAIEGTSMAKRQLLKEAAIRVYRTRGLEAGVTGTPQYVIRPRNNEAYGEPNALFSGDLGVDLPPNWGSFQSLVIHQHNPLPATILAIGLEPAVTG